MPSSAVCFTPGGLQLSTIEPPGIGFFWGSSTAERRRGLNSRVAIRSRWPDPPVAARAPECRPADRNCWRVLIVQGVVERPPALSEPAPLTITRSVFRPAIIRQPARFWSRRSAGPDLRVGRKTLLTSAPIVRIGGPRPRECDGDGELSACPGVYRRYPTFAPPAGCGRNGALESTSSWPLRR